jgi:hypothetical protein
MSRFTLYATGVLASVGIVFGAPIACPTNATLATLIALPTTGPNAGCQSQDKIFSNFAYSGGGTVASTDVLAGLVFQKAGVTTDIHGWNFLPAGGTWTAGFTLSYTISVAPGNPNVAIFASKDQIDSGFVPNGVLMTDVQTGVGTLTMQGMPGLETTQVLYPGLQSVSTVATAVIPSGNGLLSLEQEWFETTVATAPEPAAMFLAGVGLVGLSLLRRRKRRG